MSDAEKLYEQLKKIQEELGVKDEKAAEVETLRAKIAEADLPPDAEKAAQKEVDRLSMMNPAAPEYSVSRTYLDWLTGLPWNQVSDDCLDIAHAQSVLDEDHYDLEKVKDRILEYLAVQQRVKKLKGPILCFVGPPGVGKGTLYRHVATGAELLSLENDDENKVFGVSFRTPPPDSTGLPHIMEHSVLGGSRKYPVKEPFVELLKGSLQTFVNAFTFPDQNPYSHSDSHCYPDTDTNIHVCSSADPNEHQKAKI